MATVTRGYTGELMFAVSSAEFTDLSFTTLARRFGARYGYQLAQAGLGEPARRREGGLRSWPVASRIRRARGGARARWMSIAGPPTQRRSEAK